MHYIRLIKQNSNDVRCCNYYVYKCSICGEEEWFKVQANADTTRLKKCKNCGIEDDTSNKEYLIKKKHELEQQIKKLSDELIVVSQNLEAVLENTPHTEKVLS
jgi:DNA replicative helicase MCM subunit Mcm2 (Cdc46/Mcm family)